VAAFLLTGHVNEVNYFDGAVVVNTDFGNGGMTIGPYIMGRNMMPDWRDHTFVHEFGHTMQSKKLGWLYLPLVGIPSLTSAGIDNNGDSFDIGEHGNRWYETHANRLAVEHFGRNYSDEGFDRLYFEVGATDYATITGLTHPYDSPRLILNGTGRRNQRHHLRAQFHWSDWVMNGGIFNLYFYF